MKGCLREPEEGLAPEPLKGYLSGFKQLACAYCDALLANYELAACAVTHVPPESALQGMLVGAII